MVDEGRVAFFEPTNDKDKNKRPPEGPAREATELLHTFLTRQHVNATGTN